MSDLLCRDCEWVGKREDALEAPNPFDSGIIMACPECFAIENFGYVCEIKDCKAEATCVVLRQALL